MSEPTADGARERVANLEEQPWQPVRPDDPTRGRWRRLAAPAGSERLGARELELPPGTRSWPFHYHHANEEALFVLAGEALLRRAGGTTRLRAGDWVALPVGEAGAHALHNPTDAPFRCLILSTMVEPDITVYPDSGKLGLFAGSAPGSPAPRSLSEFVARRSVEYWADED